MVPALGAEDTTGGNALGYYLGLIDNKISSHWVPLASATGAAREVVINFRVLRNGEVRNIQVGTSSGEANLDASAIKAIQDSLPLPPFPPLLTQPFLDLKYRFVTERG